MARPTPQEGIRELLIVNAGGELSAPVQQGLRDKRYATRVVTGFKNLKPALTALAEPILVCEAGPSPITLQEAILNLKRLAPELQIPVIVIGDGADQYERDLDEIFPAATTLNVPYGTAEILAAINYISRTYSERKRQNAAKPGTLPSTQGETHETTHSQTVHALYSGQFNIPNLVFNQFDKLDLFGKNLGGSIFSSAQITLEYLADHRQLPNDLAVQEAIRGLCIDAGNWGQQHLARTSFVAQKIIDAMNPDQNMREHVKISAFLYAWSFAGDQRHLLQQSYLDEKNPGHRMEICSKIKDSAMGVSSGLKIEQSSKIIATLARIIGKEQMVGDDDISITASAIMAADLASRICYQNGPWNPRRAYILLSRLKKGELQELHPSVLCCTVKMLAEALAARTPLFLLKKELRNNKAFLAALQAEAKKPVTKGEKRVSISALVPGMKLSRPLRSLDGREILSPDLVLDEDLIWRIWQLSAIRPLTAPIIASSQG